VDVDAIHDFLRSVKPGPAPSTAMRLATDFAEDAEWAAREAELELAKSLSPLLADRFPDGEQQLMLVHGDSSSGLGAEWIAQLLVRRVRSGETPEQATAWLGRLIEDRLVTGKTVMALWGIEVASEVTLADGLRLVPLASLSGRRHKS
jgi:hypothetical protein